MFSIRLNLLSPPPRAARDEGRGRTNRGAVAKQFRVYNRCPSNRRDLSIFDSDLCLWMRPETSGQNFLRAPRGTPATEYSARLTSKGTAAFCNFPSLHFKIRLTSKIRKCAFLNVGLEDQSRGWLRLTIPRHKTDESLLVIRRTVAASMSLF